MNGRVAAFGWAAAVAASLAGVVVLPGCGPPLPGAAPEDAGDESFARQVVPLLHGRKVRGYEEVELLSDLSILIGRDRVVRALMGHTDYVDHWAEVMADALRVHREDVYSQASCYGAPLRAGPDSPALADWIRLNAATTVAPGGAFNMSDVLRSSLTADNLYPAYAAHLFAMQNKSGFFFDPEQQRRDVLGATFGEVYVHRQMLCLTCHNSESSLSGEGSGWNRTHPVPGYFERALYGAPDGAPTADAFAMFRTDVTTGGGSTPWGAAAGCGTFRTSVPNDPLGINANFIGAQGQQFTIRGVHARLAQGYAALDADGLQRTLPPGLQAQCDFCAASCSGTVLDIAAVANNAPNAATVKNLLTATPWSTGNTCMTCHGGTAGIILTTGADWANDLIGVPSSQGMHLVNPGDAANSYLIRKLEGAPGIAGVRMPFGASPMSAANINLVRAWIDGMPALGACGSCPGLNCGQPRNYVDGHEAFAFLTAANAVNKAWTEALGYPLTIANYYARNGSQRDALWNLTEYRFVPNDWSMRAVLSRGLSSTLFNRKAPRFTALTTAYVVPPLFDPWTVADPRVPPVSDAGYVPADHPDNHFNAMGEKVHRYSARSLLTSTHEALGWPAPQRFPPFSGYPNEALEKAIGQFFTDTEPGFRSTDLQGLLFWESVHGACAKPAGVSVDWIDRVMDAVNAFDPSSPGGPLTVQDVVVLTRDWLLGHGGIEATTPVDMTGSEEAALAAYFGVALTQTATSVPDLEDKLRGYCGVLAETPQFFLAGIAPSGLGPRPRLRVCNGTPCTYQEMCAALRPAVNALLPSGDTLFCGTDSVTIFTRPRIPDRWLEICPPGLCGLMPALVPEICWPELDVGAPVRAAGPAALNAKACSFEPPACDPRCARIDCCGGPLPPLDQRGRGLLVAWADGAEVRTAEGVTILPRGGTQFEPLRAGRRLSFGDLLAIPGKDGRLAVRTARGELKMPRRGLEAPQATVFMMVTGEKALQPQEEGGVTRRPMLDRILRVANSEWARRGEGGRALTTEEFQNYRYTDEEIGLDQLIKRGLWPPRQVDQPDQRPPAETPRRE
jgi:hypothetical protein